ncbi:MAG: type IV secretion system DNA-binding domain-containing protein [Ruminococcus flavefaciens]|nr:type IV secretion system DNA-binding domain-containing protein [Ruminococcus flavefaciens]
MNIRLLQGQSVEKNQPPQSCVNPVVTLSGKHNGKSAKFYLDESILSKHTLLIGGTGCGKTTLFYHIVEQLKNNMTSNDVMVIFDSKGDFYDKFGRNRNSIVLGNSKQYRNTSVRWNIFKEILADGVNEKDYRLNIREIVNAFFKERMEKGDNPFFPTAAAEIFSDILLLMVRQGLEESDFRSEYFYNEDLKNEIDSTTIKELINNLNSYPDLATATSYIEGGSEQGQGVLSEMYSVINQIFIGVFAERGNNDKFSMREFIRNKGGKTLFIEYDLSIGSILSPIYSLLFDLSLKEALGRTEKSGNVYLICDEFKLLPNLQHIDDAVNFGRSLGVKVFAGLQSINQLTEVYKGEKGKNIAAGFSSVYAFHANDTETREFVTGLFGKNMYRLQYQGLDGKYKDERIDGNTVEDWNMTSLKVGEAIVGLPFSQPFRFLFDDYRR